MQKPKRKMRLLSMLLAVLMLCMTVFPTTAAAAEESATASTMQLMKTEGTVSVTNGTGRSLSVRDNMRLYNGYHAETESKSYAWINLDDEKLSKLDEASAVDVLKSGKKLEMLLKSGNLYFNVTTPLTADETLNIRTSTMAVGVRGTSGWVKVLDRWTSEIYILEGTVQVSVEDPVSGQVKTAEVRGGQKAIAVAYPQEQVGDKCDIIMDKFGSGDIDGFVLVELAQDPGLCGKIYDETGMDVLGHIGHLDSIRRRLENIRDELGSLREQLEQGTVSAGEAQPQLDEIRQQLDDLRQQLEELGPNAAARKRLDDAQEHLSQAQEALDNARTGDALDRLDDAREDLEDARGEMASDARTTGTATARERLARDQQELQDKLDDIEKQLAEQDHNVSDDPVWGDNPMPSPSPAPTGGGGGSSRRTVTGQMPLTDAEVQALLDEVGRGNTVQLIRSDDPNDDNTLYINTEDGTDTLTVDEGKTLSLSDGINVEIEPGNTLAVNGTMTGTSNSLTNDGIVTVGSPNTLTMASIRNSGELTNTASGHIVVTDQIMNDGTLTNDGVIDGDLSTFSCTIENRGTINGDALLLHTALTNYGTINGTVTLDVSVFTNYGTVNGGRECAVFVESSAVDSTTTDFALIRGDIISSGSSATVMASSGATLELNGGRITNGGSGYALGCERDVKNVTFAGTVLRTKEQADVIYGVERPSDYIWLSTDYYYLQPGSYGGGDENPGTDDPGTDDPGPGGDGGDEPGDSDYDTGPFVVTGGTGGEDGDYTYIDSVLTILTNRPLTISNADEYTEYVPSPNRIEIAEENTRGAVLTLDGVRVNVSSSKNAAFLIPDDYAYDVTITLKDESVNELISGTGCAGLQKTSTSPDIAVGKLTITGGGDLTAIGGGTRGTVSGGAGIGGAGYSNGINYKIGHASNITISGSGTVTVQGAYGSAGIGAGYSGSASDITISGSVTVTTEGGQQGAGIGGGYGGDGTDITISTTGSVTATGSSDGNSSGGAGIGGGYNGNGIGITINSGTVEATGFSTSAGIGGVLGYDITITGGSVFAYGGTSNAGGPGIGGRAGENGSDESPNIKITGGTVTATGGNAGIGGSDYSYITITGTADVTAICEGYGAAIGGSRHEENNVGGGDASHITISGNARVKATSEQYGAGIGGGGSASSLRGGTGSYITISENAYVEASSGRGAGIGGGYGGSGDQILIDGATVIASGSDSYAGGAGIGSGGGYGTGTNITITNNANVKATGSGRGSDTDAYGAAGIGGGSNSGFNGMGGAENIFIEDSTVVATGGSGSYGGGAGIGGGCGGDVSTIEILGGDVTATGGNDAPGIGGGGAGGTASGIVIRDVTVTNEGTGYTVRVNEEDVTFDNAILRAVGGAFFADSSGVAWRPEGYVVTWSEDDRCYTLHLDDDGSGGSELPAGTFIVKNGADGVDFVFDEANRVLTINTSAPLTIRNADESEPTDVRIELSGTAPSADITLDGVKIDVSKYSNTPAFLIAYDFSGDVTVTLAEGSVNELVSGDNRAGLQKYNYSTLIIGGGGELTATGGYRSAGIGGGNMSGSNNSEGTNITINSGTVTATGGYQGAGIGGGYYSKGDNITITGGVVTATGGYQSAGIGGSNYGSGSNITITDGIVTATGSGGGAGIGGGLYVGGFDIEITGGVVTATGDGDGAGIGSGSQANNSSNITITGGTVTATGGGNLGAGIGGYYGTSSNMTITGGVVTAVGGTGTAGISGGTNSTGNSINGDVLVYIEGGKDPVGVTVERGIVLCNTNGTLTDKTEGTVNLSDNAKVTLSADATIAVGTTLTIPEKVTLIIPAGATLTVSAGATLVNNGTIELAGIIVVETGATFDDSTGVNITGDGKVQRN